MEHKEVQKYVNLAFETMDKIDKLGNQVYVTVNQIIQPLLIDCQWKEAKRTVRKYFKKSILDDFSCFEVYDVLIYSINHQKAVADGRELTNEAKAYENAINDLKSHKTVVLSLEEIDKICVAGVELHKEIDRLENVVMDALVDLIRPYLKEDSPADDINKGMELFLNFFDLESHTQIQNLPFIKTHLVLARIIRISSKFSVSQLNFKIQ